jgi:hypothetical protein
LIGTTLACSQPRLKEVHCCLKPIDQLKKEAPLNRERPQTSARLTQGGAPMSHSNAEDVLPQEHADRTLAVEWNAVDEPESVPVEQFDFSSLDSLDDRLREALAEHGTARALLQEIVAGLESGSLEPTAGALEPLADQPR